MVQNKIKLGRPPSFEREAALAAATHLFWERGYDNVGLSDLEAATGLNRSSIYNTFGSKEALFAEALRHYSMALADGMLQSLEQGSGGLDDLEAFLHALRRHLSTHAGKGCFMVNTMAAFQDMPGDVADLAGAYVTRFLKAARAALARAVTRGEIAEKDIGKDAEMLLGVVLGANLLARARQPQRLVDGVLESGLAHIRAGVASHRKPRKR